MLGEIIELKIDDVSRGGEGVGRLDDGRVVFVRYTASGDRVRAEVVTERKKFLQAKLIKILEPAQGRVDPPCTVFGRCGGCEWQHLDYPTQWSIKRRGLAQVLERFHITFAGTIEEYPAEQVWHYRNRVQLRGQGSTVGFMAHHSHTLVPIRECRIARQEINAALAGICRRGMGRAHYQVEVEVDEQGLVHESWDVGHAARGFRQVHGAQNQRLRSWVEEWMQGMGVVWDLFGGNGNLSRGLINRGIRVHCVDRGASSDSSNQAATFFLHRESVNDWLDGQWRRPVGKDSIGVIMDPPRHGLGELVSKMHGVFCRFPVQRLVLIGCHADAWARDLRSIMDRGWVVEGLGVMDLFPQTHHIEGLAVLGRGATT